MANESGHPEEQLTRKVWLYQMTEQANRRIELENQLNELKAKYAELAGEKKELRRQAEFYKRSFYELLNVIEQIPEMAKHELEEKEQ